MGTPGARFPKPVVSGVGPNRGAARWGNLHDLDRRRRGDGAVPSRVGGEGPQSPGKLQMAWLADPGTGRVRATYAEHYDIVD